MQVTCAWGRGVQAAAVVAMVLCLAPSALAGYGVQPADGSTVSSAYPTFLVYIGSNETSPMVEVSTSPDHNDYGFTSLTGLCTPTTPFTEANKFSCQLLVPLSPGTYYWAYTYYSPSCTTLFGVTSCYQTQPNFSGPFKFTVGEPTPPANASLVTPYDGATVGTMPTLTVHAPAGASMAIYASSTSERLTDGSPAGLTAFSCSGTADTEQDYTCQPSSANDLTSGTTYYWWAIITVDRQGWIYGPRSFTVRDSSTSTSSSGHSGASASAPSTPPSSSSHATAQQIFSRDSSGMVRIVTRCGGSLWQGSGFLIGPRLLVTALHVLEPNGETACTATVRQEGTGRTARITNWSRWYTSKRSDLRTTDFATAKLNTALTGYHFRVATSAPRSGQTVISLGYSLGQPLSLNQGHDIENTRQNGVPLLVMSLLGAEGSSGGPILNASGFVVGLTQRGHTTNGSGLIVSLNIPAFTSGSPRTLCAGVAAHSTSTVCGTG
jgi:Trypsin-like peptidase domain